MSKGTSKINGLHPPDFNDSAEHSRSEAKCTPTFPPTSTPFESRADATHVAETRGKLLSKRWEQQIGSYDG